MKRTLNLKIPLATIAAGMVCGAALRSAPAEPDDTGLEYFETKIRPILVDRCYKCHSKEAEKVKGGLLLDARDDLLKGGDTGPAIVSGDPEKSLLIKAIRYTDEDLQMPPRKSAVNCRTNRSLIW